MSENRKLKKLVAHLAMAQRDGLEFEEVKVKELNAMSSL